MRVCQKLRFESRAAANAYARYSHKHGSTGNMRAYFCSGCQVWHLTSLSKAEQRQRSRARARRAA